MTSGPNSLLRLPHVEAVPLVVDSGVRIFGTHLSGDGKPGSHRPMDFFLPGYAGRSARRECVLTTRQFNVDPDVWWHIQAAKLFLAHAIFRTGIRSPLPLEGNCGWLANGLATFCWRLRRGSEVCRDSICCF